MAGGWGDAEQRLKGHVEGELRFTYQRPVGLPKASRAAEPGRRACALCDARWTPRMVGLGDDTPHDCEPC